jgi:hypothetical protein
MRKLRSYKWRKEQTLFHFKGDRLPTSLLHNFDLLQNLFFYPPKLGCLIVYAKALVAVTMVLLWTFGIRMLDSSMVLCSAYIWRARSEIKKL